MPAPSSNVPYNRTEVRLLPIEAIDSPPREAELESLPIVLQVSTLPVPAESRPIGDRGQEPSEEDEPWWQTEIAGRLRAPAQAHTVGVDEMILGALRHSPRVRAVSNTPLIREEAITEAEARFDWRTFMDSRFSATSDPVGSTLTTGGPSRFREQNWRYNAGLRRTTETGGKFEAAQRIGYQDNNSVFFDPTQQGNAKLSLSFTQPLLNGSGRAYNQSLIVLAQIDADMANDEFSKLLQDHLLEVTRAYWELYLQRALLIQKQRLLAQARAIHERLEHRRGVDALQSQIVRAKSAVESRKAEIIRCEMNIRNTESKLRVLVNDPVLLADAELELVPSELPARDLIEVGLKDSLTAALENRPEILQAAKNVRAASVRLGISENELLPALDLVTEAYVSGLKGNSDIAGAYADQFSEGQPSVTVGLVFEVPLHNRAAKARHRQRRLELQQLTDQLQQTTDTLRSEVEVAVRNVDTAFREMQSKHRAMLAADAEVRYLTERWRLLPGEDQVATFLLEDLLDAQERQTTEEADFVTAQVTYTVALAELKRATGTLLQAESISATRGCTDGLPQMILDKHPAGPKNE
jgi:outer membrane protein TolC